jgi:hypothetical protein
MATRTYVDADGRERPDRRSNDRLRAIFDQACVIVGPFFATGSTWGADLPLDHLAYHALRDAFPDLSPEETRQIISACQRVHRATQVRKADLAGQVR